MMLRDNFVNSPNLRSSFIGMLLGIAFALYVYRFAVGGINLTLLRIAIPVLGVWLLATVHIKQLCNCGILLGGILTLLGINAAWYGSLDDYPIPRREMLSHMANLLLMFEIVLYIQSKRALHFVLNGYVLSAILAIGIGYYGLVFLQIPFEQFLRSHSGGSGADMAYVIVDGDFVRMSGPFMDPNFFGVYLLTVTICSLWMYQFCCRKNFYLILALIALLSLPLTISRTALVGLIVFIPIYLTWLPRRIGIVLLVGFLFVSILAILSLLLLSENFIDRMLSTASVIERMRFIAKGAEAFMAHPFLGSGPAGIVDEATGIATAHLMYLSLLGKFGLIGTVPYLVFLLYPLGKVALHRRKFLPEYRALIVGLYFPLLFIYFLYDFLYFLEFQYLIFAIGYSVALSPYARRTPDPVTNTEKYSTFPAALLSTDSRREICAE